MGHLFARLLDASLILGVVHWILTQAITLGIGYIVLSCACAFIQRAVEIKLGRIVLALAIPAIINSIVSDVTEMPVLTMWVGAVLLAVTECIAVCTLLVFIRDATRLRAGLANASILAPPS